MPRALRGRRVGAGQQQAPVGVQRPAGPHLLAVDHEAVALAAGGGLQAGQVGAGVGLGEALAPDLAVEDGRQVPAPLLVGARRQQRATRRGGSTTNASTRRGASAPPAPGRARPARRPTCRRPTRPASGARRNPPPRSSWNQAFWKATNSSSVHPVCAAPPVARARGSRHHVPHRRPGTRRGRPSRRSSRRAPRGPSSRRRCSSARMVTASAAKPACTAPPSARARCMLTTRLVPWSGLGRLGGERARPAAGPRAAGRRAATTRRGQAQLDGGGGRDAVAGVEVLPRPQDRARAAARTRRRRRPPPGPTATCGSAR